MASPFTRTLSHLLTLLLSLSLLLVTHPFLTAAQSTTSSSSSSTTPSTTTPSSPALQIYNGSSQYAYQGCFNETSDLPGTSGGRAVGGDGSGGAHEVLAGAMTVPKCLAFCATANNGSAFRYAGLEYARECWCGAHLSALAARVPDAQCGLPCDGDRALVCGGPLRLTVYMLNAGSVAHALSGAAAMLVAVTVAFNVL